MARSLCSKNRERDLVSVLVAAPVEAGIHERRADPPAPVAIADHHPEVSAPARKRDAKMASEQPVGLGEKCHRAVGVKGAVERPTSPLAIQRGFAADPAAFGGDVLEQREPGIEVFGA